MEKKITEIKVAADAAIVKGWTYSGRKGFCLDAVYVLEDGTAYPTRICAERKKDVLPRLEKDRANAASGAMVASFIDGKYWGTISRYQIGLSGLVPTTA